MDKEKLEVLTEEWVKEIISQVTEEDSPLLDGAEVKKIFQITQNNLKITTFEYVEEEFAKKNYGEDVCPYLRSKGLPCVKLKDSSNKNYIKEILGIQFKMYEDMVSDEMKINEASLSNYVYYSITAHFLCTMV